MSSFWQYKHNGKTVTIGGDARKGWVVVGQPGRYPTRKAAVAAWIDSQCRHCEVRS